MDIASNMELWNILEHGQNKSGNSTWDGTERTGRGKKERQEA